MAGQGVSNEVWEKEASGGRAAGFWGRGGTDGSTETSRRDEMPPSISVLDCIRLIFTLTSFSDSVRLTFPSSSVSYLFLIFQIGFRLLSDSFQTGSMKLIKTSDFILVILVHIDSSYFRLDFQISDWPQYRSQYNIQLLPVNYTWNLGTASQTSVTDKMPIL